MPLFEIDGTAGIVTTPISLADSGASAPVDVRFTNGPLWMPESAALGVTASFTNQGNDLMRLRLTGVFTSPPSFAGGQVLLDQLTVSLPFRNLASPTIDITATRPVAIDGDARWLLSSLGALLGVDELALTVGLDTTTAGVSVGLALAAPMVIPNAFVRIDSGSVGVTVYPAAAAFEIALAACGTLTPEGRNRARSALAPVFGSADPLATAPSNVSFRRRFHLGATGVPDLALPQGPALLDVIPGWGNGSAPALVLPVPDGLDLDIGLPQFSLAFDEGSSAPTQFGVRLRDCAVHLPQLGALPAFSLVGALDVLQRGSVTVLRLEPTIPGGVDLPGFVRFLLSRLRWLADTAGLEDLVEQFTLSLGELEWEQLFRGLLTPSGGVPAGFAAAFTALLNQALTVLTPVVPLERVFLVVFSAFADVADQVYATVWNVLFGLAGGPHLPVSIDDTIAAILQLLTDAPGVLIAALRSLLAMPGLDLAGLLESLVAIGIGALDAPQALLRLLMQTIAAAIGHGDIGQLAVAIMDLAVANDDVALSISLPALLGAPSLFDIPELAMPAVPALLMSAMSGLVSSIPGFVPRLPTGDSLYEAMRSVSGALGEGIAALGLDQLFDVDGLFQLIGAIIDYSAADLERELMLLRTSRLPMLGAAVTVVAVIKAAVTNPLPWWDMMGTNIEHDLAYDTIVLPAPGTPYPGEPSTARKYLIVSDVHRDKAADDRGFLNAGSIDHFAHNHDLYLRVLDWADDGEYTVIEAGDSEELWYIRDFDAYQGPAVELDEIIATNQAVYAKLRSMQHRGRHVRIKGNHDSYLDLPAVRLRLNAAMHQPSSAHPFQMYDFAIIHGVKTLQDAWFGGIDALIDLATGALSVEDYVDATMARLGDYMIGLDSTRYSETKPMIVGHGHQWDFWNCRENEFVGKMLSNLVGVPADQILDPFIDARGLAWAGEPAVNFAAVAADLPVLNNWLASRQAVRFAHQIQHQSSADRVLVDDAQFMETVAALSAMLGFEVDQPDDTGTHRGAAYYSSDIERFFALRFNQLCVGHTHFPQSQPFWNLEALLDPLGILAAVRTVTRSLFFGWEPTLNVMRSLYYNTGTAGWHEGVVWGVEITELGHARLVFWTDNSIGPETMDWELDEMPAVQRAELEQRLGDMRDDLAALVAAFAGGALGTAASAASVSAAFVAGVIAQSTGDVAVDLGALLADTAVSADEVIGGLQSVVGQVVIAAALREVGVANQRTFTLRVPVPAGATPALKDVTDLLGQLAGVDASAIPKLACGWLQVVRNLPFFGGFESRRDQTDPLDRVFWTVVSLMFQLPSTQVSSSSLGLMAAASFDGDSLVVTLTVG